MKPLVLIDFFQLLCTVIIGYGFYSLGKYDDAGAATTSITQDTALGTQLLTTKGKLIAVIAASAIALVVSFLGCCGAAKV